MNLRIYFTEDEHDDVVEAVTMLLKGRNILSLVHNPGEAAFVLARDYDDIDARFKLTIAAKETDAV